jgi:hypothetical protein
MVMFPVALIMLLPTSNTHARCPLFVQAKSASGNADPRRAIATVMHRDELTLPNLAVPRLTRATRWVAIDLDLVLQHSRLATKRLVGFIEVRTPGVLEGGERSNEIEELAGSDDRGELAFCSPDGRRRTEQNDSSFDTQHRRNKAQDIYSLARTGRAQHGLTNPA